MRLKMLETFQGRGVPSLQEGQVCDVDGDLAMWLLKHGKAVEVTGAEHYGAQPDPEYRQDDEKDVADEVEATSAALKLAAEQGVDLHQVEGTGASGRIILSDVEAYLEELEEPKDEMMSTSRSEKQ